MKVHHSRVSSAQARAFDMIEGHRKEMIRQVQDTPLFSAESGYMAFEYASAIGANHHCRSAHGAIVQHSLRVQCGAFEYNNLTQSYRAPSITVNQRASQSNHSTLLSENN